jgi:peptidoglycan/xylan/chitin deacetylase (PgdA/CDA1 family)
VRSRRSLLGAALGGALGLAAVVSGGEEAHAAGHVRLLGMTEVATARPVVALTFDDGPDPRYTPAVLDLLARRGASATFFVVGTGVAAHPDLVRRIVAEGHEVANHTLSHQRLDRLDRAGVRAQLEGGAAAIRALALGRAARPHLVRAPFGFEGEASRAELSAGGWEVVRWHGCLERYLRLHPGGEGAAALAGAARPGHILLAHDGGGPDRRATLAALPGLLDHLGARGLAASSVGGLQRR